MSYAALKHLHLLTIFLSLSMFLIRGAFSLQKINWVRSKPVRLLVHTNDTLLLAAALSMCYYLQLWPFYNSAWITAKVVGLIVYVGLGTLAIRRANVWGYLLALLTAGYIIWVAINKQPWPNYY
mgnify:CR=1 FL=1